jgi:hypothetical protein
MEKLPENNPNKTRRGYRNSWKWRDFEDMVRSDLSKLNDYKRGIFVLVDREGVFSSNSDWWRFVYDLIPKSKSERRYQNIKAYYMSYLPRRVYSYGAAH